MNSGASGIDLLVPGCHQRGSQHGVEVFRLRHCR